MTEILSGLDRPSASYYGIVSQATQKLLIHIRSLSLAPQEFTKPVKGGLVIRRAALRALGTSRRRRRLELLGQGLWCHGTW